MTPDSILAQTEQRNLERAHARPFLKWAGGKRALLPEISKLLPSNTATYWEPFVGGGAVFFALDGRIRAAKLSDVNAELMLTYKMVRDRPEELIQLLRFHEEQHADKKYYYLVRKLAPSPDASEVAARFIYLNKGCFNGLYRVNKQGAFNVPRGDYANPSICDADVIRAASEALGQATISVGDFVKVAPEPQDFIYCDPPYHGTFDGYDASRFGEDKHRRLRDTVLKWHRLGAFVLVSNADTPLIRSLYAGEPFRLHNALAPRNINSDGSGRGPSSELLITTYGA